MPKRLKGAEKFALTLDQADARLTAQFEIPILSHLLGMGQAFFLGADAMVPAFEEGRTLPEAAVLTLINVDFITQNIVRNHHTAPHVEVCNECVSPLWQILGNKKPPEGG